MSRICGGDEWMRIIWIIFDQAAIETCFGAFCSRPGVMVLPWAHRVYEEHAKAVSAIDSEADVLAKVSNMGSSDFRFSSGGLGPRSLPNTGSACSECSGSHNRVLGTRC
jgi:hypothetical protein